MSNLHQMLASCLIFWHFLKHIFHVYIINNINKNIINLELIMHLSAAIPGGVGGDRPWGHTGE